MKKDASLRNWLQLSAYLDGELSEASSSELDLKIQSDSSLQEELNSLKQIRTILRNAPRRKVPRNFLLTKEMVQTKTYPVLFPIFSAVSVLSAVLFFVFFISQLFPVVKEYDNQAWKSPGTVTISEEFTVSREKAEIPDQGVALESFESGKGAVDSDLAQEANTEGLPAPSGHILDAPVEEPMAEAAAPLPVEQPKPTSHDESESVGDFPTDKIEMTLQTESETIGKTQIDNAPQIIVQSTSSDVLKNTISLTPTVFLQQPAMHDKNIQLKDQKTKLLLQISSAVIALGSGFAAYFLWKKTNK